MSRVLLHILVFQAQGRDGVSVRTDPVRWFAAGALSKYPHLVGADAILWDAFIQARALEYQSFAYDVRVGKGRSAGEGVSVGLQLMWAALTRKRIDVVGRVGAVVDLFEIKENVALGALGQVVSYRALWAGSYPDLRVRNVWLVFETIDPDAAVVAEGFGVGLIARSSFSGPLEFPPGARVDLRSRLG